MERLPIDEHLKPIAELMTKHQNLVIKASPGSGKTTRIPPFLNSYFKKILVLEPRRIAAISACDRIATEQNWPLGQKVGYHVRFDKKYTSDTEIVFLTEALLARKLLQEESLKDIDLIILDEFHERSLWTDLCLGIIKEWQELGANLKLMILSATLDQEKIQSYLQDCQIYHVELPKFPLEVVYSKTPFKNSFDHSVTNKIIEALKNAIENKRQHILIFLPGTGEITKTKNELLTLNFLKDYAIEVLHGNIPLSEQRRIIQNKHHTKSIILSTNLAESSVTINNLDTVIDSGLIKISDFNIKTSVQQLNLKKISQASAEQRQGRANRQAAGLVYKLWLPLDEKSMEAYTPPEIVRSELSVPLLFLTYLGVKSELYFKNFSWFEMPSEENLKLTTEELLEKKLIGDNKLTKLGFILLTLNLDYHLGLMIIWGKYFNRLKEACMLVALLQEKDILPNQNKEPRATHDSTYYSDLLSRFEIYLKNPKAYSSVGDVAKALEENFSRQQNSQQQLEVIYQEMLASLPPTLNKEILTLKETNDLFTICRFIIDYIFIDKLCKRRKDNFFLNTAVNKFGTETIIYEYHFKSVFYPKHEFYLSLKTFQTPQKDLLSSWVHFIPVDRVHGLLAEDIQIEYAFNFNEETQRVSKRKNFKYHHMILKSIDGLAVEPEDKNKMFKSIIMDNFSLYKQKIPSLSLLFERLHFLLKQQLITALPDIDWNTIVSEITSGESNLESIINKDWDSYLQYLLPKDLVTLLNEEAPLSWSDPQLKKTFKIHYEQEEAFIESKLQHFFGIKLHPAIGSKVYKLKIVMLGPNGRPIQITKDLLGFWKTSYPEIRKELRGRYPKHAWPEDPCVVSDPNK